ncbi:DNA-3-methyladenine glycosylase [Candidatus Woesebacteria bacterium]|nr:DNA-3-methyladenine glycosylase [Candidatus Woesebacteria bacterium]MCD8507446.1 DNA-3-methyladenine glycosylase [Candidatus Woesebacteria bacterium]MCD8526862.1 DNA-3-methyladenine glycosylase [Candidatus Woesebacteria bacterium]MCD8545800.1 DNA-3-methyladenine glycosylase [Candidatus Woesebacteria bacterium]
MSRLPRNFYAQHTLEVATELLGKVLVVYRQGIRLSGEILEVEAYTGTDDPASHAFRGPTPRNQPMFSTPGHTYVYFTYGMHHCVNVVAHDNNGPGAVLIRAVRPLEGLDLMQTRRKNKPFSQLTNGPAKLCQAFQLDRQDTNIDLVTSDEIWIEDQGKRFLPEEMKATPRIGISTAMEKEWRFIVL